MKGFKDFSDFSKGLRCVCTIGEVLKLYFLTRSLYSISFWFGGDDCRASRKSFGLSGFDAMRCSDRQTSFSRFKSLKFKSCGPEKQCKRCKICGLVSARWEQNVPVSLCTGALLNVFAVLLSKLFSFSLEDEELSLNGKLMLSTQRGDGECRPNAVGDISQTLEVLHIVSGN